MAKTRKPRKTRPADRPSREELQETVARIQSDAGLSLADRITLNYSPALPFILCRSAEPVLSPSSESRLAGKPEPKFKNWPSEWDDHVVKFASMALSEERRVVVCVPSEYAVQVAAQLASRLGFAVNAVYDAAALRLVFINGDEEEILDKRVAESMRQ